MMIRVYWWKCQNCGLTFEHASNREPRICPMCHSKGVKTFMREEKVYFIRKDHYLRWLEAICKAGKKLSGWMVRQKLWLNVTTPRIRKIIDGMEANDIEMIEDAVGRRKKRVPK